MSFTYHIEAYGHIARVTGKEEGSLDSASGTFADLIADPHLLRPFGLLIDVRALRNIPSQKEAHGLSEFARAGHNDAKHFTALLVEGGIQYGVARMIQIFSELQGAKIDVFIDEQAAQYWLWKQLQLASESTSPIVNE